MAGFSATYAKLEQELRDSPPDAAIERYQITTREVGGFLSESRAGALSVLIDEPASFGGTGAALNPAEILLAAVGSSLQVTCRMKADHMGIPVSAIAIDLKGELDARGFFDLEPNIVSGFGPVTINVRLFGNIGSQECEKLMAVVRRCCPMLETIERSTTVHISADVIGVA